MEIIEVPVIKKIDSISGENGSAVHVCVFKVCEYHKTDLIVSKEQIEDKEVLHRDVSQTHTTSL